MTKYFKRTRNETRTDENYSWGTSIWYFQTNNDGLPIRQIELYENGNRLKYDSEKQFDDYGQLRGQPLNLEEFSEFEIEKFEFDQEWAKSNPKKEHKEILNLISNYLASHYDQRFGQALLNIGINEQVENTEKTGSFEIRDIHGDSDEKILNRVKSRLKPHKKHE